MRIAAHTQFEANGEVFVASSARSLVTKMNRSSFDPCQEERKYMCQVAERVTLQDGTKPRTDTFHHFVEDLVAAGFVRVLGCIDSDSAK